MKRSMSESNLSTTKLSPSFAVLYPSKAAKQQRELDAELTKVATYLAARRLYRNAFFAPDPGFDEYPKYYYFLHQITIADVALTMSDKMCADYLRQQSLETMSLMKIPDTTPEITAHLNILAAQDNKDKSEFRHEVMRAITEKDVDTFTEDERRQRDDLLLMSETLFAFAKCGTVLPFRAMFAKISPDDQKAILNKYGLHMLHHATIYNRMDFIRELLKYDLDINAIFNSEHLSLNGMSYPCAHSILGSVVSQLIYVLTPAELRKKPYDQFARFLTTKEGGQLNDYQLEPYTAPDLLAVLAQKEEIIRLLQVHGADNNVHAYMSTLEPGTPTAPRKGDLAASKEKFPTIKEYCEKIKNGIDTMSDHERKQHGEIDVRVKSRLYEVLDLVIAGPECVARQRCG